MCLAEHLPAADRVDAEVARDIEFIDAGENFESVSCPGCGQSLDDWWGEAMSEAAEDGFTDLLVTTPCCGASTSLNDLVYEFPQAFARFSLSACNPGVPNLPEGVQAEVERLLGCPTRTVLRWI